MKNKIYFFYPKGKRLTGQEMASQLILDLLEPCLEFNEQRLKTQLIPVLDRDDNWLSTRVTYAFGFLRLWLQFFLLLFARKPVLYLNICQTWNAVLREGVPFLILAVFRRRTRAVISLHGQNFCSWPTGSKIQKIFKLILSRADVVTVLGEKQRQCLISWGLDNAKVRILNNTCEINAKTQWCKRDPVKKEVNLLYLSNLIETKGYREYLEALELLAYSSQLTAIEESDSEFSQPRRATSQLSANNYQLSAILCGKLTDTCSSSSENNAEVWIAQKMESINASGVVRIEWIKGAYGDDKQKLFDEADVFVFPTRYATEAQPIVLIEAMASGCAIITSQAGEIPSMVDDTCAVTLADPAPRSISTSIQNLISRSLSEHRVQCPMREEVENTEEEAQKLENDEQRTLEELQLAAKVRFEQHFSQEIYRQSWLYIFKKLD